MKKSIVLFALLLISSCTLTTEELEAEVKASIIETLKDDPEFEGVQVIDLSLIHKGGNEYIGILNVIEPNTVAEAWNTLLQLAELSDKDLLKELNEVDTTGVQPLFSVTGHTLPQRTDVVSDGDKVEDILANAPEQASGFFVVPKVVE